MKNSKSIFILVGIGLLVVFMYVVSFFSEDVQTEEPVMCTADAMECPDGTYVGRTGPDCEFVCPNTEGSDEEELQVGDTAAIQIDEPAFGAVIESPLQLSGQAIGPWYFEASLPVELRDWQGEVIAQSYVSAEGNWMTVDFVPFIGEITFTSPYADGDADEKKQGSLVFKKDNPSGLPEHDAEIIVPIFFAE